MERKWLKEARCLKGLSQEAVAEKVEITRQTYLRYESGERNPRPLIAARIGIVLGVDKGKFFWPE